MNDRKDSNSTTEQDLMNKVNEAFDDIVQDVRSMVQEKEQKNSEQ